MSSETALAAAISATAEDAVGWIRISRPERLNAFADDMRDRLDAALAAFEADTGIRCVVITGTGRAFSTGGDVHAMARLLEAGDTDAFDALVRAGARIVARIDAMRTPVIAALNGIAVGAGACLALACDIRIAAEGAALGFGFARVGLHPDWGGTWFLPRLVGPGLAAELLYTGAMVRAERAERMGLVNRVVSAEDLEAAARALAGEIAARPAEVIADTRAALRATWGRSLAESLEAERAAQAEAFASPDAAEGIRAFLEKRSPTFNERRGPKPRPETRS
ncbi:MAG TPA: enoyl-CoA hydratase-related protein [Longimicrobiales bacterium]|nr:enoyl-CoA hydratase-related protein [Longimicrobiales bacterium]